MSDTTISVGDYTKLRELFPAFGDSQKEEISRKFNADVESYKKYISDVLKIALYAICSNDIKTLEDYQSEKTVAPINEAKAMIKDIVNYYHYIFYPSISADDLPIDPTINISIGSGGSEGFYLICHIEISHGGHMVTDDIVYPGGSFQAPNENEETKVCKVYNPECPLCTDHLIEAVHPASCPHHLSCGCKCATCVRKDKCKCYEIMVKENGGVDPATLVNVTTMVVGGTVTESTKVEKGKGTTVEFYPDSTMIFDYINIDTEGWVESYDDISKFNTAAVDKYARITYDDDIGKYVLKFNEVNADIRITVIFKERVVKPAPYTITLDTADGVYVYNERDEFGHPIGTALHKGYDVFKNDDCNIDFYISKHATFNSITIDGVTYNSLETAMAMLDQVPNVQLDATILEDGSGIVLYKLSFFDVTGPHAVSIKVTLRTVQLDLVVNGNGYLNNDPSVKTDKREVYEGDTPTVEIYVPSGYHVANVMYNRDGDDIDENEVVYVDGGEYALGTYTVEKIKDATINRFTIKDMEYNVYFETNVVGDMIEVPVSGIECKVAPNVESPTFEESMKLTAVHGSDMQFKISLEHAKESNIDISRITKIKINDTEYSIDSTEDLVTKPTTVKGLFNLTDNGIVDKTSHEFLLTIAGAAVDNTLKVEITAVKREFTISEKIINARVASPELPITLIYGSDLDVDITADYGTFFTSLVVTNGTVSSTVAIKSDTGKSTLYSFGYVEWDKLTRSYTIHFRDLKDNYTIMGSTVTFDYGDDDPDLATKEDIDALFGDDDQDQDYDTTDEEETVTEEV